MSHNGRLLRDSLLLCQTGQRRDFPASHGFPLLTPACMAMWASQETTHSARPLSLFGCGDPAPWEVWMRSQCLGLSRKQLRGWRLAGPLVGSLLSGPWEGLLSFQKQIFVLPSHQRASV